MTGSGEQLTDLSIERRDVGDQLVLTVSGEVDLATAGELESAILDCMRGGTGFVLVDLRGVTFIDASGLRALLAARDRAERSETQLSVLTGDAVRRLLELLDLTNPFDYVWTARPAMWLS